MMTAEEREKWLRAVIENLVQSHRGEWHIVGKPCPKCDALKAHAH